MVFTEEDATDDAKLKNEVSGDLQRVARERSPRLFEHFENVCESMNQTPGKVLADMLIRAIDDDAYADTIANQEVTMDVIQTGDFRKDDIKLVKDLSEELGVDFQGSDESIVDRIIESRIESVSTSPLDSLDRNRNGGGGNEEVVRELNQHIQHLERKVDELEKGQSENVQTEQQTEEVREDPGQEKKDIDELFGSGEEEQDEEVEKEDDEGGVEGISVDVGGAEEEEETESEEIDIDARSASDIDEEEVNDDG